MCWTLRCVLYTGYAAWQIKRIRTYIRRGMVYRPPIQASRPPHSNGCPNQNLYRVYLSHSCLLLSTMCLLFFPPIPSTCSFSPLPQHLLFDPLRRRNVAAHCLPSLSLCLSLPRCFYLSLFLLIILILFLISIDCC